MKSLIIIFLIVAFIIHLTKSDPLLVLDFLRHGARAPMSEFPYFKNITWQKYQELTPVGQRMHYLLGRLRRQQYIEKSNFLPKQYDPAIMYIRATSVRRTEMSVQSYMLGLYPEGLPLLNDNQASKRLMVPPYPLTIGNELIEQLGKRATFMNTPPIHLVTLDTNVDKLLQSPNCPVIGHSSSLYHNDGKYKELLEKYMPMWTEIVHNYPEIPMNYIRNGEHAVSLCDFLICAYYDGVKPHKISDTIIDKCKDFIGIAQRESVSYVPEAVTAAAKPFAEEILGRMNDTLMGKSPIKYAVYGSHDTTLTKLLNALHELNSTFSWIKTPPLAGNVLFELGSDEQNLVTIFYNGARIHQEPYTKFAEKFERIGMLNVTYEESCIIPKKNMLRNNINLDENDNKWLYDESV